MSNLSNIKVKAISRLHDEIDIELTNLSSMLNFWIARAESEGFKLSVKKRKNKLLHTVVDVGWEFP
jgi:hypothetical protein